MHIISVKDRPELLETAAQWFHEKWHIPLEAYRESMTDSLLSGAVPQWYIMTDETGAIIAGLGVIENDFHKRKDLAPNIAAVYVEEKARMQGISRALLDHVCGELKTFGRENAYLITTHTQYYEHCGFEFFTMVEEDDGGMVRMYRRKL